MPVTTYVGLTPWRADRLPNGSTRPGHAGVRDRLSGSGATDETADARIAASEAKAAQDGDRRRG